MNFLETSMTIFKIVDNFKKHLCRSYFNVTLVIPAPPVSKLASWNS